ncbi:MAG: glycosyltransferase [Candidatus Aenigmatarchaeota archaeon]
MKLLFYFGGFAPVGGIEVFCSNFLEELSEYPVNIDLLVWGKNSELLENIKKLKNVEVHRFFWRWGCRFGIPDKFILSYGKKLLRKADIVLFGKTFSPSIHFALDRIRSNHKPPFIYITPYRPSELWKYVWAKYYTKETISQMLRTFYVIVVQGKNFADDLAQLGYQGRIEVIPYIVHHEQAVMPLSDYRNVLRIGFLGRLEKAKNLDYLINAFYLCKSTWQGKQKLELHLFGDGSEKFKLIDLVKKLNLIDSVIFHGQISPFKVREVIDSCHMFAFSSITEGQCLAGVEILSRGRPIVGTPAGALPEIIKNEEIGLLAPYNNVKEYSKCLLRILNKIITGKIDPGKIRKYFEENFSRQVVIKKYWELLTSLL